MLLISLVFIRSGPKKGRFLRRLSAPDQKEFIGGVAESSNSEALSVQQAIPLTVFVLSSTC